jgi:signal peptidase I
MTAPEPTARGYYGDEYPNYPPYRETGGRHARSEGYRPEYQGHQGYEGRYQGYQEAGYQTARYRIQPDYRADEDEYDRRPANGYHQAGATRERPRPVPPGTSRSASAQVRPRAGSARTSAVRRRKRKGLPLWQELPLLLVIAFCLALLVRTFLLQAFFIPSGSMEDTLIAGDRVLVNKVVYNFRQPARGEVVVFRGTDAWAPVVTEDSDAGAFARIGQALGDLVGISRPGEKDYIKRVIGVPGDRVSCCDVDGRVFVNGQPLNEEYVIRDSPLDDEGAVGQDCRSRRFEEIVVPPGHMFVMGDHRQVSQDSRCQGTVPIENVIGRAFMVVWPTDRWHGLSPPDTFAGVPAPAAAGAPGSDAPVSGGELALVLPLLLPLRRRRRPAGRARAHGRASGPRSRRRRVSPVTLGRSARSRRTLRLSGRRLST